MNVKLSVSAIKCLINEPDKFYKRHILRLKEKLPQNILMISKCIQLSELDEETLKMYDCMYLKRQIVRILNEISNLKKEVSKVDLPLNGIIDIDPRISIKINGKIDYLTKDKRIAIRKFSKPPSKKTIESGIDPTLPILSYILKQEFGVSVTGIEYWHMKGYGDDAVDIIKYPIEIIDESLKNAMNLIYMNMENQNLIKYYT